MPQNHMNEHGQWAGAPNTLMTAASIMLTFFAKFALSDIAAGAAILAALTTAALNIQKFIQGRKAKKESDQ